MRLVIIPIMLVAMSGLSSYNAMAAGEAASGHSKHGGHVMAEAGALATPVEAGQSAFAAIAEIVAILNADPETDWSAVDIDALREHLVDMDELTLNAAAEKSVEAGRVVFRVSGKGGALRAIQAMVPAHAAELSRTTPWKAVAEVTADGVVLTVAADEGEVAKIAALGFFGVMATGAHHQAHHLRIAQGWRH